MNPKLKSLKQLKVICHQLRKKGKKIVFTNGCFDILHFGHVQYFRQAKKLGDVLIVGLNTDQSVRKLKGPSRPFNCLRDRAGLLGELLSIDWIVPFQEETPLILIKELKPAILVKGADWPRAKIVGKKEVEAYGGQVKRIPLVKGRSTSRLVKKLCKIL